MPPVAPPPPPRTNLPSHDKNIHLAKFLHCSGVCVILFCEDFLPHIFSLQGRLCLNCCLKDRSLFQLATYSAFVDFQDFLNKGYYNALQWTAFWHKNLHNVFNTIWEHLLLTHQIADADCLQKLQKWQMTKMTKSNPRDLRPLRHCLHFWQLRTTIWTFIVSLQLRVTGDSIRNSCGVLV